MVIPIKIGESLQISSVVDVSPERCLQHFASAALDLGWSVGRSRDGKFLISAPYGAVTAMSLIRAFIGAIAEPTWVTVDVTADPTRASCPTRIDLCIHVSRVGALSENLLSTLKSVLRCANAHFSKDRIRPRWIHFDRRGFEDAVIAFRNEGKEGEDSDFDRFFVRIEPD